MFPIKSSLKQDVLSLLH